MTSSIEEEIDNLYNSAISQNDKNSNAIVSGNLTTSFQAIKKSA